MADIADLAFRADSSDIKRATGDLDKLDAQAKRTGKSTRGMGTDASLANKAFGAMGGLVGQVLGPLAAFATIGAGITGTVRTIKEFEQSMAQVAAISRASSDELVRMEGIARELGASTVFSASQAADGMKFLSQAGFTASESIAAIPQVLDLAAAAGLDLATSADIASNVMSGFGIAATQAGGAVDTLAAIASRANTDVTQLGSAVSFVGPVAAAMGISLGDASAAIGVLSDAGIQGSAAGTGLRRVLSSLANPTKDAADVLGRLGLTLEEVDPATNDLTNVIDALARSGLDAADALTIFGDRGGPAVLALTANAPRVRELAEEMANVDGEAKRMADTMSDTLAGDAKELTSALSELALKFGDAGVTGAMRGTLQMATMLAGSLGFIVDEVRALFGFIDSDDVIRRLDRIAELEKQIENARNPAAIRNYKNRLAELQAEQEKWERGQVNAIRLERQKVELFQKSEVRLAAANMLIEEGDEILAGYGERQEAANKESAKFAEELQAIVDAADPASAEIRELTLAAEKLQQGMAQGIITGGQWAAFLDAALPEVVVDAERISVSMEIAGEKAEKAAKKTREAWDDARGELSDFFFEMAADGKDAFDTLVDGFQAMINKMLADFAASGLIGLFQGKGLQGFSLASTSAGGFIDQLGGGGGASQGLSLASSAGSALDFLKNPSGVLERLKAIPDTVASFFDDISLTGGFTTAPSAAALPGGGSSVVVRNASGEVVNSGVGVAAPGGLNWAQIGAGLAAGFVGNLAGQAVFDNEGSTGVGSAAGGIVGGIAGGPLGVGIGTFLGEGLEKVLGDVFGFGGKAGANKGGATFNLENGTIEGFGIGNFDQKNTDLAVGLAELAQSLATAIGGSSAAGKITSSGSRGFIQLGEGDDAQRFKGKDRADKVVAELFQQVIESADNLDPSVQRLLLAFEGSGEQSVQYADALLAALGPQRELSDSMAGLIEQLGGAGDEAIAFVRASGSLFSMIDATTELDESFTSLVLGFKGNTDQTLAFARALTGLNSATKEVDSTTQALIEGFEGTPDSLVMFTEALVNIRNILDSNPVSDAVASFEASMVESGTTIAGAFIQQSFHVRSLAQEYDGTAAATVNLQNALAVSAGLASEYALVLERTKLSVQGLTETTADYFRVSTLSEQELQDKQVARLNELEDVLESTLDPQLLQAAFSEYTELSRTVFDGLTDSIDPDKFKEFGESFAANIESFGEIVQGRLEEAGGELEGAVETQFGLVDSMLGVHAASYDDSARRTQEATTRFERAVDVMERSAQQILQAGTSFAQQQNITLTVNGQRVSNGSEVSL